MQETENLITLRAFWGKQQGKFTACPVKDKTTGRLKGVKVLSPEEARNTVRAVDKDTTRDITDGLTLNLNDEVDKVDWEWIKENKEISMSLEDALNNPNALYYVDQPDKEIENRNKLAKDKFKAMAIVMDASNEERMKICRYLGQNVQSFSPSEIEDYLNVKADKNPEQILNYKKDPHSKTKLFLYSLIDAKKIQVDGNGTYRYGEIIVGLNLAGAIQWLNSADNRDIVGKLYLELNGPADATLGSVVDDLDKLHRGDKNNAGKQSGDAGKAANESSEDEEVL